MLFPVLYKPKRPTNHQCLLAQTEEPRSLSNMVNSLLSSEHCRNKIALMRAHNSTLITDYNSAMANDALKKDIAQLHLDVNQQKCWVYDYKKILNIKTLECDSVSAQLELLTGKYKQNELNIKKFDTSSDNVRNLCNVQ
ncbi:hypothetical protein Hanom_Chr16g01451401 [Helianthus anomalus]